ncbi:MULTISPECIES: HlyC/CorC family transporter [Rhizobium]|uniref:HlyC/CorC family transporter n=1 Tax=Rhizobium rhododendri TaxID=2506430 RepID=A0ABY8IG08_9HYPH|nr:MULTISPECIES: HlyC/CorC family transporter [Rhizobium]MBO9100065.1 HlyC/CorC family transporter [Rhizobium sp. L58/93]MBO9135778.1 HlyC/CorC family transporter [Rhizobium sp. B209b/85]MBO9170006.1 HlyC/CorC family transporter [Rhizobium sp. L245/93]MBO9185958.1 HlyC/CorC family transporter [Rhizobium sp. E27B/91]MBZ5760905.1 HlyC/CorC family transporter [Rhizobium sp. VS19-DR96]
MTIEGTFAALAEYWPQFLSIVLLVLVSAFFSGSETALTAASRSRMHTLEANGEIRAAVVNGLIERRDRLIGALLIGNNLANILSSSIATSLFLGLFGSSGVALATLAMTVILVIFAEVLPKSWAISAPDRFALYVAPMVKLFVAVVGPLSSVVNVIVRQILALFGINLSKEVSMLSAHEELRGAVDFLHREGSVVKADRDRLGGVLDLSELELSDIMVHRTSMRAVNADDAPEAVVRTMLESPYTRMPLWRGTTDNIIGVIHAKDLLRALAEPNVEPENLDVAKIAQKPWFVPDSTNLEDQLNAFLRRKQHFAVVVDEYGEVQGIVTLEDILEEIVGDIADEHDLDIQGVRQEADGSIVVDGVVPIRDLNRALDWNLPDEEATTIAGLVIHESMTIPEERQAFTFYGKRFIVMKREKNRITKLRIRPAEAADTDPV